MKKPLTINLILILVCFIFITLNLYAATVVLRSGLTIKGKFIARTDEEITIKDSDSGQVRVIKSVFIRDLVMEPDEKKNIKDEKKQKGKDLKLRGGDEEEENLLSIIQPTIGILPGISYPFGKLGENLALGYGGSLFTDVGIPMKPEIFKIRLGLNIGFFYHPTLNSDYASSLMLIPITAYMKFQFITKVGVRPYIKIGGGITPVLSSGGNSVDPTFTAALGLGYVNSKIPYMEFFIEAGMMMAFEQQRGDFITANIGVAYRFGSPPATVVSLKMDGKK